MKKRILGRTGVPVSELCFGTMNFGWTIDRGTAFDLLDTYREAGGSFLQAVHLCPGSPFLPETFNAPEEWLGEWLRERAIPRNDLMLSTRLVLPASLAPHPSSFKDTLLRYSECALRKIGVPYLDLLVYEWTRAFQPMEVFLDALEALVDAGYVRKIGLANFPLWRAMEMVALCRNRRAVRLGALQTEYSGALPESARAEVNAFCHATHTGLLATSALEAPPDGIRREPRIPVGFSMPEECRPEAFKPGAAIEKLSRVQRALSWVLSSPQVSSVVISVHSVGQLNELMGAANKDFNDGYVPEGASRPERSGVDKYNWRRVEAGRGEDGGDFRKASVCHVGDLT